MANKSQKKKFGEFRIFMEYVGKGKYRVNPAFLPSLAAWLLMHGCVYRRTETGLREKLTTSTVPGLKEAADVLELCQRHLQRLMDSLPNNFDGADWQAAVLVISQLMNIEPDSTPAEWVPPDQFHHIISERPTDGPDAPRSGNDLPIRSSPSPHEQESGAGVQADGGTTGSGGLHETTGSGRVQQARRNRGRKPGRKSK